MDAFTILMFGPAYGGAMRVTTFGVSGDVHVPTPNVTYTNSRAYI